MSTVTKDASSAKHITLTLENGNLYEVIFYEIGKDKRYVYITNTGTGDILCGNTSTLAEGNDDVLKIPPAEKRLFVMASPKNKLCLSGVSTCEVDVSDTPLFNLAPASAYARAVAKGYTGTAEEFYTALAGIDETNASISELAEQKVTSNELTTAVSLPHTHRVLMAEVNPGYIEPQMPFALEAFKGGYMIENCNFEAMVAHASEWKYECDILVIAAHQLEPYYSVTSQNVYDAVAEYMAAGVKILLFTQDGGRLQKYTAEGVGDTKVSLLPLFSMSFVARNFSAGTGSFSQITPCPLPISVIEDGTYYPQGSSLADFSTTDPEVILPITATQDGVTAKCVAIKPGAFAVVAYAGTISGNIPESAYYRYVKHDAIVQLLLEKPVNARVSMDLENGHKIAAIGVDADVTTEPDAIMPIVKSFGADRKLEIGLVADKVTADLADWYRSLDGVYLCSHTYYHASGLQRITVTDELVTINPNTNMGRVKHPCKVIFTGIKNAADDTAFTVTGVSTSYRLMPAQGVVNFWIDTQTSTSYDGYIRVNTADAAKTLKVSYTYYDEYKEHLGSIEKLRSLGALTDDVLYLTAGNLAMMPITYKYALDHNQVICEYQNFPNNSRLRVSCYPLHEKVPTPMGYTFQLSLGTKVNDAYWTNYYTKADAKATLIPSAIAYCNANNYPYVFYIHDFPLSTTSSSRIFDNPDTGANADWVKGTIEEVREYQQEFLEWLIAQFEAQGCVWMTRGQYTRRYYDMQRYLSYSVEQTDGVIIIKILNRGTRPLKGLTFRVPLAQAPESVTDSNGASINNVYNNGELVFWLDVLPASSAVIRMA